MRLLLVGAFSYPHAQGSQVYFQEQAIALRSAGAEVDLLTYGPVCEPAPGARPPSRIPDPDRERALDGFTVFAPPAWSVPRSGRSGPKPSKFLADGALALALRRASKTSATGPHDASAAASCARARSTFDRRHDPTAPGRPVSAQRYDAILAHHAEAALIALHLLPAARPPVVYCAHTLLEQELPEYFKGSPLKWFSSPRGGDMEAGRSPRDAARGEPDAVPPGRRSGGRRGRGIAAIGRGLDRWIAARADAWIAMTQESSRVMSASSDAPGRRLGPPIPSPDLDGRCADAGAVACAHGLQPGGFFLYAGNLDPYQDLPLLARVARARAEAAARGDPRATEAVRAPLPIVLATHDPRAERLASQAAGAAGAGVQVRRMQSAGEARALLAAARASLVPRRSLGGFPIKLANSLAAGIPVVALHGAEWGLDDGRDALIGTPDDPVGSLVRALDRLERDPALVARLGAGARATWHAQHEPARIAAETLALIEALRASR